jgi:BON domain-containing protein
MARDYEDIHNVDDLDDAELRRLVLEQLAQSKGVDIGEISVRASHGSVTLIGRVGTDGERRIADHVLTDVLGILDVTNDLVVDPNVRTENAAPDLAATDSEPDDDASGVEIEVPMTGDSPFFADAIRTEADAASDLESVMEDGTPWSPPDSPTPEGLRGTDARPEDMDGQH